MGNIKISQILEEIVSHPSSKSGKHTVYLLSGWTDGKPVRVYQVRHCNETDKLNVNIIWLGLILFLKMKKVVFKKAWL